MTMMVRMMLALAALILSPAALAENQFKLLVFAMPSTYHYEYIPIARDSLEQMARLQRSCHRLIWLNPLLGSPRYRPLTKGMQAALAWVDDFLPVHNLASLDALAVHLSRLPHHRSVRRPPGLRAATALTARGETLSKTSN